jgi:hypothetical protein
MRILVWATTFGADLWNLVRWLDARADVDMKVVLDDPELFARQSVARLHPLRSELIRRQRWHGWLGVAGFRPDVTILDNWVPRRPASPAAFVLWHGFGWKGPNDREEFASLHRELARNWSLGFRPPHPDERVRTRELPDRRRREPRHPETPVRSQQRRGRLRLRRRPRQDGPVRADLALRRGVRPLGERRRPAGALRRAHPSPRCESHLSAPRPFPLRAVVHRHDRGTRSAQVADVLVTNFSSIANLFYATGRPTIHVYPVRSEDEAFTWRTYGRGGETTRTVSSARYIWKFPPEQNGGLLARSFDEVLTQLDQALDEPDCCRDRAQMFLREHMLGADGQVCARIWDALGELV